jgi:hypothetical protein
MLTHDRSVKMSDKIYAQIVAVQAQIDILTKQQDDIGCQINDLNGLEARLEYELEQSYE